MNRSSGALERAGATQMSRRGFLTGAAKLAGAVGAATALSSCHASLIDPSPRPVFTPDTRRSLSVASILTGSVGDPRMLAFARTIEAGRQKAANAFGTAVMSVVAYSGDLPKGLTVMQGKGNDGIYNFGVVDTVSVPGYSKVSIVGVNPAMGNTMDSFVFGVERGVVSDMSYGGKSRLVLAQLSTSPGICDLDFQDLINWVDRPDMPGLPAQPYPAGPTDRQSVLDEKKEWEDNAFEFIANSLPVLPADPSSSSSPR